MQSPAEKAKEIINRLETEELDKTRYKLAVDILNEFLGDHGDSILSQLSEKAKRKHIAQLYRRLRKEGMDKEDALQQISKQYALTIETLKDYAYRY